jgi:peptidoglycan/LPS O-acetylase OafA/YrhL
MARNSLVDGLKVIASQLIVWHHLSAYGPLSDAWDVAATLSSDWFFDYGRMAVQVFLVVGGFLAARALTHQLPLKASDAASLVVRRYFRLALPLVAALAIAIPSGMLARHWATFQFFPVAPTWGQFWSHVLLIQTITGDKSLSAGVWYIAIDFQLYVLITVLAWLGRGWFRWGVAGLMLASLLHFNITPELDNWGIYFFGAYGLGALACWAGSSRRPMLQLGFLGLIAVIALAVDFRGRIAVAGCVAVLLGWFQSRDRSQLPVPSIPPGLASALAIWGDRSYALFLVHFSVVMLANALYAKMGLNSPFSAACAIMGCWAVSMRLSVNFERWVQYPLSKAK